MLGDNPAFFNNENGVKFTIRRKVECTPIGKKPF